jgi:hypothetical protein
MQSLLVGRELRCQLIAGAQQRRERRWAGDDLMQQRRVLAKRGCGVPDCIVTGLAHPAHRLGVTAEYPFEVAADGRRERVEQLVQIDDPLCLRRAERSPVGEGRLRRVTRNQRYVAIGDPGQAREANRRGGSGVQGPDAVVDLHRDLRHAVGGQPDRADRADRLTGDPHVVAGHELAGIRELGMEHVHARPQLRDQQQPDADARHDQRRRRGPPRGRGSLGRHPPTGDRGLAPQNS